MVWAMFDLVIRDDAQPTSPAVPLEGNTAPTYGELIELVGVGAAVFQRKNTQPADVIYIGRALLPTTLRSIGNPESVRLVSTGLAQR
jgi:hypothetical protein